MPLKSTPVASLSGPSLLDDGAEPSVDFLNSAPVGDAPKSTIGVRKIQSRKPGLGGKKAGGLGATKVKTNFDEIEQRATMADQMKEAPIVEKKLTVEEEEQAITSVRLAYQDLSIQRQKVEDKMKTMDPNKAKQMERLGMGFGSRNSGVSHSMLSDMKVIDQDQAPTNMKSASFKSDNNSKSDFFDDYSTSMYSSNSSSSSKTDFRDAMMMGFEPIDSKQNITTMFSPMEEKRSQSSVADRQPSSTSTSSFGRHREKETKVTSPSNNYDSDSIQKKFAGAKGISSDQFFGNDSSAFERNSNLTKFQGSTSISSDQYFGDDSSQSSQRRKFFYIFSSILRLNINFHLIGGPRLEFHSPDLDMDDIKDSVRTGVHKVAGKLSSLANNVNSFIHDKYGH